MRPKTPPRRLKTASRGAQDAPKTTQGFQDGPRTAPRRAQDGSRTLQDAPRTVQDAPPGPTKKSIFSSFFICWIFGGSLVGLWWVFGPHWSPRQTPTKDPPKTHQRPTKDPPKIQHMKNEENIDFLCRITSMHRKTITKSNKKVLQNATKNRRS